MTGTFFPDPASCPDTQLLARWEAVLGRAPRLRPWLGELVGRRRVLLLETVDGGQVERILWTELERWLRDFEALPPYAAAAIATTVEEERPPPPSAELESEPAGLGGPAGHHAGTADSPERALGELQTLLSDPAFALAFHCVEVRLRPRLASEATRAPAVPEAAWLGLLHASAPAGALLTPDVAVGLVLRVLSAPWARLPATSRKAALRLFQATPGDLRAAAVVERLAADLPPAWNVSASGVPGFVAVSIAARTALAEACGLCARLVAATRRRSGGLSCLDAGNASPAAAAEIGELHETARYFKEMAGFHRLLALL